MSRAVAIFFASGIVAVLLTEGLRLVSKREALHGKEASTHAPTPTPAPSPSQGQTATGDHNNQQQKDNSAGSNVQQQPPIGPKSHKQPPPTPVQTIRLIKSEYSVSEGQPLPHTLKLTIVTDETIDPVSFVFKCDDEISDGSAYVGDGMGMYWKPWKGPIVGHPNWFGFYWEAQPFTPEKPMTVYLLSKRPLKLISFERAAITWHRPQN